MGRRIAAYLTISAMLWHAIVGCCAHHVHAEDACCGVAHAERNVAASPQQDHDHSCCGHQHAAGDAVELATHAPSPANTDHQSHCSELRCFFVMTDSGDLPAADVLWAQVSLLTADDLAIVAAESELPGAYDLELPSSGGAAMRRHLALGVLLI